MFSCGSRTLLFADWPEEDDEGKDKGADSSAAATILASGMSPILALIVLALCLGFSYCCCSYMLWSVPGTTLDWRLSKEFVGVIVLPLHSIVAHQSAAITAAGRSEVHRSLALTVGSACQTALLVVPLAVLVGMATDQEVTLNFHPFQACVLLLAALVSSSALSGGESNWLEGAALTSSYGVVVLCYFFSRSAADAAAIGAGM
mmetsp:Transcript_163291/g.518931  ORF Transcript_163291/g.518931 Transcript_163291/m.518931 type:complete len:203 (-) Transcript_163291:50-658(-)